MTELKLPDNFFFRNRIVLHMLFWVGYVCFFALITGGGEKQFFLALRNELFMLPIKLGVVYLAIYSLIPRFLLRQQYMVLIGAILVLLAIAGVGQRLVVYYLMYPIQAEEMGLGNEIGFFGPFWDIPRILQNTLKISFVLAITASFKILQYWYKNDQAARLLEKEALEAELNFLKAQIHPHFLFNTLNNLYSLTLKKSEHAPEVVLRLSGLVNYMLYDTRSPRVPLNKEVECLHHYIALEKIRYGNNLEILFDVTGSIDGSMIAPMLLLPFVENSFKHGVSDEIKDKWIAINLNVNQDFLTFKVENAKSPKIAETEKDYVGGIGLKNVKRRLELLYPGAYELRILDEAHAYLVVMKINLSKTHEPALHHR